MNNAEQPKDPTPIAGHDETPAWHGLSQQQLSKARLDLTGKQQQRVTKSLTRLHSALKNAGLCLEQPHGCNASDTSTEPHKRTFAQYLATFR